MGDSDNNKSLDDILQIPRSIRIGTFIVAIIFDILMFTWATLCIILQNQVNSQLGFDYATPDEEQGEIFIISEVVPGKIMDQAGLKEGDIIPWNDVSILYRMLVYHQESAVSIPVIRGVQYLMIRIEVPILNLTIKPDWVYWV